MSWDRGLNGDGHLTSEPETLARLVRVAATMPERAAVVDLGDGAAALSAALARLAAAGLEPDDLEGDG